MQAQMALAMKVMDSISDAVQKDIEIKKLEVQIKQVEVEHFIEHQKEWASLRTLEQHQASIQHNT